ncbi:hypothetical protein GCM10022236_38820 [Microlunatus ginsengisoli]|uniref:Glycosyltransferase 2-like domain-containing protein n=2 Tax=Microlunatus ginsengisoli TaxID=363863 RepID=A0ABP7AI73_9ACTN
MPFRPDATVSVVIPCFNYAHYLPVAVASVLSQEMVHVEVIIVDDASSDDSVAVARRLARDSRVRVITQPWNQGPVDTFNRGMAAASGEFLVRLDADDALTSGSLARAVSAADAFPSAGLVYGRPKHFSGDVPLRMRTRVAAWRAWPGRDWLAARCADGFNVITSPEVVMRRSVAMRAGGQRDLAHAHDMEMWFRLAAFADVVYVEGPDQAFHRDHPGSLSTRLATPLAEVKEKRAAFDLLFAGEAGDIPGAARMQASAQAALARQALRSAAHDYDRGRATSAGTDAYLDFAAETYPAIQHSAQWRRLSRRIALGQKRTRRRPQYTLIAAARRARDVLRQYRWLRHGTYSGD